MIELVCFPALGRCLDDLYSQSSSNLLIGNIIPQTNSNAESSLPDENAQKISEKSLLIVISDYKKRIYTTFVNFYPYIKMSLKVFKFFLQITYMFNLTSKHSFYSLIFKFHLERLTINDYVTYSSYLYFRETSIKLRFPEEWLPLMHLQILTVFNSLASVTYN